MKKKNLIPFSLLFCTLLPMVSCGSKDCVITFDPNNGEETFSIIVKKGSFIPEPEEPKLTAYTFSNWKFNKIKWSFNYEKVQGDMTLVAFYTPTKYTITANPLFGFTNQRYESVYTVESNDSLFDAYCPGYEFNGWFDEEGNKISSLKGLYGDKYVTPKYTLKEGFVEFGSWYGKRINEYNSMPEDELNKLIPNDTFEGEVTYRNQTFLRKCTDYYFDSKYSYFEKIPLLWQILHKNNDGTALLFCTEVLEGTEYNISNLIVNSPSFAYVNMTDFREYMNTTLLDKIFTADEKEKVLLTTLDNGVNAVKDNDEEMASPNTQDYLFLPSYYDIFGEENYKGDLIFHEECYNYLYGRSGCYSHVIGNTPCNMGGGNNFYGPYVLRTPTSKYNMPFMTAYGEVGKYPASKYGIRPCVTVNLNDIK